MGALRGNGILFAPLGADSVSQRMRADGGCCDCRPSGVWLRLRGWHGECAITQSTQVRSNMDCHRILRPESARCTVATRRWGGGRAGGLDSRRLGRPGRSDRAAWGEGGGIALLQHAFGCASSTEWLQRRLRLLLLLLLLVVVVVALVALLLLLLLLVVVVVAVAVLLLLLLPVEMVVVAAAAQACSDSPAAA